MITIKFWQYINGKPTAREAEYIGKNPYNGLYGAKFPDGFVIWLEQRRVIHIDEVAPMLPELYDISNPNS